MATVESPAIQTLVGPSGSPPPTPVLPPVAVAEMDAVPPAPVLVLPPASLLVTVPDEVPSVTLVLLVLPVPPELAMPVELVPPAELAPPTVVVALVPLPMAVVAENPPVPSVVLVSGAVVAPARVLGRTRVRARVGGTGADPSGAA